MMDGNIVLRVEVILCRIHIRQGVLGFYDAFGNNKGTGAADGYRLPGRKRTIQYAVRQFRSLTDKSRVFRPRKCKLFDQRRVFSFQIGIRVKGHKNFRTFIIQDDLALIIHPQRLKHQAVGRQFSQHQPGVDHVKDLVVIEIHMETIIFLLFRAVNLYRVVRNKMKFPYRL